MKKCETRREIEAARKVRRTVFVAEQNIDRALEFDGLDDEATHFVAHEGEKVVGAARLLLRGETADIGRVAVLAEYRGKGTGRALISAAEEEAALAGAKVAVIHAQTHTAELYKHLGYEITSDEFMEAGIPHFEMKKPLPSPRKYVCKVCGHVNKYVPAPRKKLVCARCGYKSSPEDHAEVL
ncbi:MAG: GNAT family N-acetyltransferase [Planctomycetota bacterium]